MARFTRWFKGALDHQSSPNAENQFRTTELGLLPNEVKELEMLQAKAGRFAAVGFTVLGVAVLLSIVSLLSSFGASQLGPVSSLAAFDIPKQLSSALSASASSPYAGGFSSGLTNVQSFITESAFPLISWIAIFLGGIAALFRGSIFPVLPGIFLAVGVNMISALVDTSPHYDDGGGSGKTERTLLAEYAGDMDAEGVLRVLQRNEGLPLGPVLYVTAQADLAKGIERTAALNQAAAQLRSTTAQFVAKPEIAYLIERGADGRVETVAAKSYFETATAREANARLANGMLTAAAVVSTTIGTGLFLLGLLFRKRYSRIRALLSFGYAGPESDKKAVG